MTYFEKIDKIDDYCDFVRETCCYVDRETDTGCPDGCRPCRHIVAKVIDKMYAERKKMWHNFANEKPTKDGFYVVIYKGNRITSMLYFVKTGMFNWDGCGEDLHFDVDFWAEADDLVAQAKMEQ